MYERKMNSNIFWATLYTTIAVVFMVMGFDNKPVYFYGAIVIGFVAIYWIVKAWRNNKNG